MARSHAVPPDWDAGLHVIPCNPKPPAEDHAEPSSRTIAVARAGKLSEPELSPRCRSRSPDESPRGRSRRECREPGRRSSPSPRCLRSSPIRRTPPLEPEVPLVAEVVRSSEPGWWPEPLAADSALGPPPLGAAGSKRNPKERAGAAAARGAGVTASGASGGLLEPECCSPPDGPGPPPRFSPPPPPPPCSSPASASPGPPPWSSGRLRARPWTGRPGPLRRRPKHRGGRGPGSPPRGGSRRSPRPAPIEPAIVHGRDAHLQRRAGAAPPTRRCGAAAPPAAAAPAAASRRARTGGAAAAAGPAGRAPSRSACRARWIAWRARAAADPEGRRDLLVAQPFQLAHHDRRPLGLGQRAQALASGRAISSRRSASSAALRPPPLASYSSWAGAAGRGGRSAPCCGRSGRATAAARSRRRCPAQRQQRLREGVLGDVLGAVTRTIAAA